MVVTYLMKQELPKIEIVYQDRSQSSSKFKTSYKPFRSVSFYLYLKYFSEKRTLKLYIRCKVQRSIGVFAFQLHDVIGLAWNDVGLEHWSTVCPSVRALQSLCLLRYTPCSPHSSLSSLSHHQPGHWTDTAPEPHLIWVFPTRRKENSHCSFQLIIIFSNDF